RFRNIYNCSVIAIRHRDEVIRENLSEVMIKEGDLLIVYGSKEEVNQLISNKIVILISEHQASKINYKKAIPAIVIAIGVVAAAAFNLTSILISSMVGSLLIVTTSILKPKEAYE